MNFQLGPVHFEDRFAEAIPQINLLNLRTVTHHNSPFQTWLPLFKAGHAGMERPGHAKTALNI
jgi:hypothetical protein